MANTPLLGLTLPVTGTLTGTWGDVINTEITTLIDSAIAGTTTLTTDADVTLTTTVSATNQAREAILLCTGARTAIQTITAPAHSKTYIVINATTGGYSVKLVGAGPTTGVTIVNGSKALVAWNGSDFVLVSVVDGPITGTTGTFTGAVSGTALTATTGNIAATAGNLTFGGTSQRITGEFSNATVANRVMFQTSTVDGNTVVGAMANGTGTNSQFTAFSGSDPANASTTVLQTDPSIGSNILAGQTGSGGYLPLRFLTSGLERMRIDTTGNVIATGDVQSASQNGGQLAGLRNKIINGNMGIFQRGTAAVTTTSAYGPADRWQNGSTGNTFSATRGSFVSGDTLYDTGGAQFFSQIAVTSVAGASNISQFQQYIEDVRLLAGQTVTVSFWAKVAAGTPSIGLEILQSFGTGGSPSANAFGIGQAQALTTTWTKYSKTFTVPSINGKTVGTDANTSSTRLVFWLDAGSDFNTRSGSIGQSSKTVSIAQVQLEIGAVATPFEQRPIGMELALCQRYYQTLGGTMGGYTTAATGNQYTESFPVQMRATPSIVNSGGSSTNATSPQFSSADTRGAVFSSVGVAAGGYIAGANGAFSAEL